jgi:small GTP-binding protein
MLQKKVCMLGAFAVGKTSLVRRFVESIFSDAYQTTIGVKIDKKVVRIGERDVTLVLWDLYGEDDFRTLRMSYLRGASGYLLVADGTRPSTLDNALEIRERAEKLFGPVPFVLALNKCDLEGKWELKPGRDEELTGRGWKVIRSSAKTGAGVEEAFASLATAMVSS